MALLRKSAPTAPAAIRIPSLAETSPAYAALIDKRSELIARKSTLEREADEIRSTADDFKPDAGRAARVAAMLDDEVEPPAGGDRLAEIAGLTHDISAAIAEVDRRIATERQSTSRTICEGVRKSYAEAVSTLAGALIAAHHAHRDVLTISDQLNDEDIAWVGHLPPMHATRILGAPNDNSSALARWMQGAALNDFISYAAIPSELSE